MSEQSHARGVVLLYHRVALADLDPFGMCVSPDEFAFQIRYVKDRCQPMTLEALAHAAQSGSLPNRSIAVTLDDGYEDNLTTASRVLGDAGVPATFFATTAGFGDDREFWWDTLTRVLLGEPVLPRRLELDFDGQPRRTISTGANRLALLRSVHDIMRLLPVQQRDLALLQITLQVDRGTTCRVARPMTGAELQTLAARPGHEIGAHTRYHLSLPAQPAEVGLEECRTSREHLESWLNRPVRSLAYPFGDVTDATAHLAVQAGFTVGVTTVTSPVTAATNTLRMPRLSAPPSRLEFVEALERVLGDDRLTSVV